MSRHSSEKIQVLQVRIAALFSSKCLHWPPHHQSIFASGLQRENRLLANKQEVERPFRFLWPLRGRNPVFLRLDLWNLR